MDAFKRRWLSSSPRLTEFDYKRRDRSEKPKPNPILDAIVNDLFVKS